MLPLGELFHSAVFIRFWADAVMSSFKRSVMLKDLRKLTSTLTRNGPRISPLVRLPFPYQYSSGSMEPFGVVTVGPPKAQRLYFILV